MATVLLRTILPSARGREGIDALNNAMKDTDAALKPGCRAGWGRRGGLKRIPRRHTLQEWETTTALEACMLPPATGRLYLLWHLWFGRQQPGAHRAQ